MTDLSKKMAALGAKGGKSTWAKMTPEQKTERAHKMLLAREAKRAARKLRDEPK